MTRAEKKIKLELYLEYKQFIQVALNELERLQVRASGVGSLIPSDMPHGSSKTDKMASACIDAVAEEKRLKDIIVRMQTAQQITLDRINTLNHQDDRDILKMVYIDGLTTTAISGRQGKSVRTIENRINRALDMLQI